MSILSVPSPVLAKRHFEEGEASEGDRHGGKRARQRHSPVSGRCVQFAIGGLHAVPQTTLAALIALFPGMDDRVVSNVLTECGNNIEAAIQRLGELRLSAADAARQSQQPDASPASASTRVPQEDDRVSASPSPSAGPTTAEQWVDTLVAEMSAANSMDNAKQRAAGFLRQFEAFVAKYVKQQHEGATGAAGGDSAALQARANKLAEENAVLKKAVQIQHRQLQERASQETEVAQLKAALAQYQEQVRTLQVSNYSLSLHLQKATNSTFVSGPRNPDVF